jgi:hypothetical protein
VFEHEATLRKAGIDPGDQAAVLSVLATTTNRWTLEAAIWALALEPDRAAASNTLRSLARHPTGDVRAVAVGRLMKLTGSSELAFFRELLSDTTFRGRDVALWPVTHLGSVTEVPAVAGWLRSALARATKTNGGGTDAPRLTALRFLDRFWLEEPTVEATFAWCRSRLDRLGPEERDSLPRLVPYFSEPGRRWVVLLQSEVGVVEADRPWNVLFRDRPDLGFFRAACTSPRLADDLARCRHDSTVLVSCGDRALESARAAASSVLAEFQVHTLAAPSYAARDFETTRDFMTVARAEDDRMKRLFDGFMRAH